MRAAVIGAPLAALAILGAVFMATEYFDAHRPPGRRYVFEDGFVGSYCLVFSPEQPSAPVDAEGFTVYLFGPQGTVRTGTFPPGKGSVHKAEYLDRLHNTRRPIDNDESPCYSIWFGDRAILLGRVGAASCPRYDASKALSFDDALSLYCRQ